MSSSHSLPNARERFLRGWFHENPTYVQLLGMCPTLAVTNNLPAAVTMAVATGVVLVCSNVITSLIRRHLQPHLRILVFTLTIAAFVTIVDRFLAAFVPAMSRQLGPYVPLIIVNCIIISRAEACAAKQSVWTAIADALGQSGGFLIGLSSLGIVREILGSGTLWGARVLPESFPTLLIFVLPAGAFFTLGMLSGIVNAVRMRDRSSK